MIKLKINLISIIAYICVFNLGFSIVQAQSFSDVSPNHPHYQAVEYLKKQEIIKGYQDGTFKPDRLVNRAEALKMIFLAKKISPKAGKSSSFKDVETTQWYFPYVETALKSKFISGHPDGTFQPSKPVNQAEFLKIFFLAYQVDFSNYKVPENPIYSDLTDRTAWYIAYFDFAKNLNILTPDSEYRIIPNQNMTRAEVAEVIYRFQRNVQGGQLQMYLSRAEAKFSQTLFQLSLQQIDQAAISLKSAKDLVNQAFQKTADQSIIQGYSKLIAAFDYLLQSYQDLHDKHSDLTLQSAGLAFNTSEEANTIYPALNNLVSSIKNQSKKLADQIRAGQK